MEHLAKDHRIRHNFTVAYSPWANGTVESLMRSILSATRARRESAISAHNKATNIIHPSFEVGDFVLVRRANDRGHKLRFRWYGPCRVTAVHGSKKLFRSEKTTKVSGFKSNGKASRTSAISPGDRLPSSMPISPLSLLNS